MQNNTNYSTETSDEIKFIKVRKFDLYDDVHRRAAGIFWETFHPNVRKGILGTKTPIFRAKP